MDVANCNEKLLVVFYRLRAKSPLEEVTCPVVASVEIPAVRGFQLPHEGRDALHFTLNDQMDMIAHEYPCKQIDVSSHEAID